MADLISRLRARLTAERAAPETGHNAADRERAELIRLLRESADALEAVQEAVDDIAEWGEPAKGAHVERIHQQLKAALRDNDQEAHQKPLEASTRQIGQKLLRMTATALDDQQPL